MRYLLVFAITTSLLAGCGDFPDLDHAISPQAKNAPYPELLPMDQAMAGVNDVQTSDATTSDLETRAADLRRRAALLANGADSHVAPSSN